MKYNFNEKIDRTGNHSAKWEELNKNFGSSNLLPMWIADMEFKTAPEIIESMRKTLSQGIFGYVSRPASYYESARKWCKDRFFYDIDVDTIIHSPGVVPTLSLIIRLLTEKEDKIMIQTPVYYPFYNVIKDNGRELVTNPLVKDESGYYEIDFTDFEKKVSDPKVKFSIPFLLDCEGYRV